MVEAARVPGPQGLGPVKTLVVTAVKTLECMQRGTILQALGGPHTGVLATGAAHTEQQQQQGDRRVALGGRAKGVLLALLARHSICKLLLR
jgi:hypothetical protein